MGISAYGTIAFNEEGYNLHTIRADGTGFQSLNYTGITTAYWPQYSVDGTNRISFMSPTTSGLYVGPGTGGTATKIQSNSALSAGIWSPNGGQIAYAVATSGMTDAFVTASTGGTATDITPTPYAHLGTFQPMAWSADGVTMLAVYTASGASTSQIVKFDAVDTNDFVNLTPTGDSDLYACFSPDGSKILTYRTSANGATPGIYISDAAGVVQNLLIADAASGVSPVIGGLEWSPFLPKETVVAASASTFFHHAASGYLISQNGGLFGSVVAFTATTPADAAIQTPSSSDQFAPLAFTLTADSITSLGYINNYFNPGTTISLTSTPSVVVTIDAGTGQVDLVAPASTAKPAAVRNSDGTLTYSGKFKALYDGTGRNLAPSGMSRLTVNPKTGKLVSWA